MKVVYQILPTNSWYFMFRAAWTSTCVTANGEPEKLLLQDFCADRIWVLDENNNIVYFESDCENDKEEDADKYLIEAMLELNNE